MTIIRDVLDLSLVPPDMDPHCMYKVPCLTPKPPYYLHLVAKNEDLGSGDRISCKNGVS